jgi:hypothetical protein
MKQYDIGITFESDFKDSEGTLTQFYIQTIFTSSNVSISVKILKPAYPQERTISH